MKKFRIGVVGAGAVAQGAHVPGYAASRRCKLVAVADPLKRCLKDMDTLGFKFDRSYRDYREMLKKEELDAVSVCVPNMFHREVAVACARRGIDILLEKPIAATLADARAIVNAVKKYKIKAMMAFSWRFYEHCMKAKKALAQGKIGRPYMAYIRFAHSGPIPFWAKTRSFYDPKQAGGGALLDMGIHAFDLIQWLIGPATAVQAKVATLRKKIVMDDNAVTIMEFGNRCLGYVDVSWTSSSGFVGVQIMGDDGSITIDCNADRSTIVSGTISASGARNLKTRVLHERTRLSNWERQMQTFINGLGKKKPYEASIDTGMASLKVALAAFKSSKTGRRVVIQGPA